MANIDHIIMSNRQSVSQSGSNSSITTQKKDDCVYAKDTKICLAIRCQTDEFFIATGWEEAVEEFKQTDTYLPTTLPERGVWKNLIKNGRKTLQIFLKNLKIFEKSQSCS